MYLIIFIAIVVAAVVIVVGIGLYLSGTPSRARAEKFDQQRVNDLMQITGTIDSYYNDTHEKLPDSLQELNARYPLFTPLADPLTHKSYEYRVVSTTTYELCATFQTDQQTQTAFVPRPIYDKGMPSWRHPIGRTCFTRTVTAWSKPRPIRMD